MLYTCHICSDVILVLLYTKFIATGKKQNIFLESDQTTYESVRIYDLS